MTDVGYYRASLLLPVGLGAIGLSTIPISNELPPLVGTVSSSLATFGLFGGIPYVIFCVLVLVSMRDASVAALRRLTWIAPLILLLLFWLVAALYDIASGTPNPSEWPLGASVFGAFVLAIGYTYALLVEAGFLWRRRRATAGK